MKWKAHMPGKQTTPRAEVNSHEWDFPHPDTTFSTMWRRDAAKFQALSTKTEERALACASFLPTRATFLWFHDLNSPGNWILLHIKVLISIGWSLKKNYKSKTGQQDGSAGGVWSQGWQHELSLIPWSTRWEKRTDPPHRMASDLHTLTH